MKFLNLNLSLLSKSVLFASTFALGGIAQANVLCSLIVPADMSQPNIYNKEILTTPLADEVGVETSIIAFIKADGTASKLTLTEFQAKKDFSDVDGATYFAFQHAEEAEYLISYGTIDAKLPAPSTVPRAFITGAFADFGLNLTAEDKKITAHCDVQKPKK